MVKERERVVEVGQMGHAKVNENGLAVKRLLEWSAVALLVH